MCKLAVDKFLPGHGGMQMCGFKLHAEETPHLTLASVREEEKSGKCKSSQGSNRRRAEVECSLKGSACERGRN
jgi:hypothetical protein